MDDLQREIGIWATSVFARPSSEEQLPGLKRHAIEEFEELKQAICNADLGNEQEEAADLAILCFEWANCVGFSLREAVEAKMAINRKRTWRRDAEGFMRHVKEESRT